MTIDAHIACEKASRILPASSPQQRQISIVACRRESYENNLLYSTLYSRLHVNVMNSHRYRSYLQMICDGGIFFIFRVNNQIKNYLCIISNEK